MSRMPRRSKNEKKLKNNGNKNNEIKQKKEMKKTNKKKKTMKENELRLRPPRLTLNRNFNGATESSPEAEASPRKSSKHKLNLSGS